MKKFFYATMCVISLFLSGCGYDDDEVWNAINDQEERIAALEEWQKTANENIAALQAIVNGNDYITSVEEIKEGDEVIGYTINFYRQGEVTIYNGKDGEKGDMPVISVTEGEDGRWYWTVNGELLEDANGNPVCASGKDGEDGEDGEDGQDGQDGQDGTSSSYITPVIKLGSEIGDGYNQYASYISVDGGRTWTQINVALDWLGGVLESIEQYSGYYLFKFSENKWGYNSTIQIPIYSGGLELSCVQEKDGVYHYTNISNGVLSVNAGEAFTIECHLPNGGNLEYTLEQEENVTKWEIEKEEKDSWNINLNFAAIENSGTATLKFTLILSNNEVTYYQVTITASKKEEVIIEKTENAELAEALAGIGVGTTNEEGDIVLTQEDITNTTSLDLSNRNLNNLEGLEVFTNVTELNCSNNPLTSLDVSAFTELEVLDCSNCFNRSSVSRSYSNGVLDLSANTKLRSLSCSENGLTELILPDSPLTTIYCHYNQLTTLDLSKNEELEFVNCEYNQITEVDLSKNIALADFHATGNKLTQIDLKANTQLTDLSLYDNDFTALDVSANVNLEYLSCGYNELTALDVSKNDNLTSLSCESNRMLTLNVSANTQLEFLSCGSQRTAENLDQQLILTINKSQQALWENSWENSESNNNVVLDDDSVCASGGSGSNFGNGGVY